MKNEIKITFDMFKILYTINALDILGYYSNHDGIYKILKGILDSETKQFSSIITFGSRISISKKRLSLLLNKMVNNNFINKKKPFNIDINYYLVNENTNTIIKKFLNTHKVNLKSKINSILHSFIKK